MSRLGRRAAGVRAPALRHRIATRLWLGMMALVAVVLVLLWLFQIVFFGQAYTAIRESDVASDASGLAAALPGSTQAQAADLVAALAYRTGASIEWYGADGKLVLSSGTQDMMGGMGSMMGQNAWNLMRLQMLPGVMAGTDGQVLMTHPRLGTQFFVVGRAIRENGAVAGVLLVTLPMPAVAETVAVLRTQFFWILGILTLVSLVLSLHLARSFSRPIRTLTEAARRMAAGQFDVPVRVRNRDEIGELAATLERMGRDLSRVEGLRREFIANMSHDLRTPLTLIRGYAESIRDLERTPPETRRRQLDSIVGESEHLARLVDDLLDLSRMQSESPRLDLADVRLDRLAAEVAERFRGQADALGMRLSVEVDVPCTVRADSARLEQVLYNLLQNALQHASSGGAAAVRVLRRCGAVRCEIADDGPGIPPDERDLIWERFHRSPSRTESGPRGTGLGLAIVRSILVAHGAPHGVDSPPGAGATFWFELPAAAPGDDRLG